VPAQFFLDVTASRVCLPVDPEAEAVRRACAPLFPPALPLVVTQPFPFAWREWIPDETADAAPWVLEPGLGAVRCGRALLGHQVLDETGVVLWRETPDTARQVVAALRPWAAVCALAPPDQDDLGVLAADGDMTVVGQGDLVQAFPLAPPQDLQFANAAMALFPLMPGPDGRRQARLPRRQGAFLLQSFIHSRLPETDIELPYIPPDNAWEVSCANLGRRANGACIAGRQAFPAVAVFTGRAMGVSGAARAHVADALARRAFTSFPCPADVAGVLPVPGSPEPGTTPPPPDTPAASPAAETGLAAMAPRPARGLLPPLPPGDGAGRHPLRRGTATAVALQGPRRVCGETDGRARPGPCRGRDVSGPFRLGPRGPGPGAYGHA